MDTLQVVTIISLIALFASLSYTIYKKKYDIAIGILIMTAALIIMRYVIK